MYFDEDIEVSASKAADEAYNKVIIDGVKTSMYEQYGIELWVNTYSGSMSTSHYKSKDELNKELVNAIAKEKAKPDLRGADDE